MTNEAASENQLPPENAPDENVPEAIAEPQEDFAALLSEFERSHTHKPASGAKQLQGTVVSALRRAGVPRHRLQDRGRVAAHGI